MHKHTYRCSYALCQLYSGMSAPAISSRDLTSPYHLISFDVMQSNTPQNPLNSWLSLDEAAAYIGSGKTVLYALARDGRIPANKVGKKWAFERTQLDLWLRSNKPIETFFADLDFNI